MKIEDSKSKVEILRVLLKSALRFASLLHSQFGSASMQLYKKTALNKSEHGRTRKNTEETRKNTEGAEPTIIGADNSEARLSQFISIQFLKTQFCFFSVATGIHRWRTCRLS